MKKKILPFISSLFLCTLVACSESEDKAPTSSATVTKIVATNFNTTASPFTPIDSTTYTLDSQERIVGTERRFTSNSNVTTNTYIYNNGKIAQIESRLNNVVFSQSYYAFSGDDLTEYRTESISNTGVVGTINKHTFYTIQDTIYSNWERSTNGGTTYSPVLQSKMVIQNGDRTFYESYDPINLEWKRVLIAFDANHNPVTQTQYILDNNGVWTVTLLDNYIYSNLKSPFYKALESSLSRKTLGMTYHLVPSAINAVHARQIAPFCIESYSTTWGGVGATNFQITNTAYNTEYAKRTVINCTSGPLTTSLGFNYYF